MLFCKFPTLSDTFVENKYVRHPVLAIYKEFPGVEALCFIHSQKHSTLGSNGSLQKLMEGKSRGNINFSIESASRGSYNCCMLYFIAKEMSLLNAVEHIVALIFVLNWNKRTGDAKTHTIANTTKSLKICLCRFRSGKCKFKHQPRIQNDTVGSDSPFGNYLFYGFSVSDVEGDSEMGDRGSDGSRIARKISAAQRHRRQYSPRVRSKLFHVPFRKEIPCSPSCHAARNIAL